MITSDMAASRAAQLMELACKAGADHAEATAMGSESESVGARLGKLEEFERSEGESYSLRVFIGQQSASVSGSDAGLTALTDMASRAVDMARHAPADPYARLAPAEMLSKGPFQDFDLLDSHAPTPTELRDKALEIEAAGRDVQGVTNGDGGNAGYTRTTFALATSNGFTGAYSASSHYYSASMIAGEGDAMQRDYEARQARHLEDLPSCAEIGRKAGERAVERLNPVPLASGTMPVVFDPRAGDSLIAHLLGAMNGMSAARRSTFLLDKLEDELFPTNIRIMEDPHMLRAMRSRPFDGEGLATHKRALVENGRVFGWMHNLASGAQMGAEPTGHATRGGSGAPGISAANVYLEAGAVSPDELIADIKDGVYITELIGQGVNGVTGDYSRGASGFRIRDGKRAEAVSEFTIAGNLLAMFAGLSAANDLEMHDALNVPTLRVDMMRIAGAS